MQLGYFSCNLRLINLIILPETAYFKGYSVKAKKQTITLSALFFKYYTDTARYNLAFCFFFFLFSNGNIIECLIIFATIGGFVSFGVYQYYQNIEYYFYRNGGITKRRLQIQTLIINLILAVITLIILWIIKSR